MESTTKEILRSIYKTKRQELIKTRGNFITQQLAKQLEICIEGLQYQKQTPIKIIGSYFPDIKREIIPPKLERYQYAYPHFAKKEKGEVTPLMQFKLWHNENKNLQTVHGIKVPSKQLPTVYPELVLVPLICFSAESNQRIGYGGGYYDRYINFCRKENYHTIFIGIGAQELKTQQDFKSDNDECLQFIITESHIY